MACDNGRCPCIKHMPGVTTNCKRTEPPKCAVCGIGKTEICRIMFPCRVCGAAICTSCGPGLYGDGHVVCTMCKAKEVARM